LVSEESGWHFAASNMTTKQREGFNIEDMAQEIEKGAPRTWEFNGTLLGDGDMEKEADGDTLVADDEPSAGSDSDESYWDKVDEIDL
ncbi:hypothetical protein PAXRUDRAFT_104988, partial [Paxillus rubicundulus Ve08.2h10]